MKFRKKLFVASLAAALAVPMAGAFKSSVYAESSVQFLKVETGTTTPVGNATVDFYQDLSKIFSVKTDPNGKLDKNTVVAANNYNASKVVKEDGTLNLPDGTYSYVESKAPIGFMLNPRPASFTIVNGVSTDLQLQNQKFPENKGQLIIKATDKNTTKPLSGVVLNVSMKDSNGTYKLVATVTTDTDGLAMGSFIRGEMADNASLESAEGSLLLAPGTYRITETQQPTGYTKISQSYDRVISAKSTDTFELKHSTVTPDTKVTGVKIRVIDKDKNPVSGRAIEVYKVNSSTSSDLIFDGKTGSDGYFDSANVTSGSKYLNTNGVLEIPAGKYYYKLKGISGAAKHNFTVAEGKVTDEVLQLTTTTSSSGKSITTAKPASTSSSSNSTLAKTGSIDASIVQTIGLGLVAAGAFIVNKRRK